ncbi:KN motif and ankyrin repeat domain-containing protein 1-like isoform X1 [Denticeps clupeoides]|uniref:KN motif and ankyrin repeat domain-containing protein 1-like isoform X1 n=1 Tax=Denticeps clupeoides TaxID=299321 RepID=UPI0010A40949|nr:KN motif and ankyrin repeat domain-containing protein 1-like isoform X1 [Denticeps clupeoides]XP_028827126.1 KN motif and ankyrin repeat domain-containing protein 1-like isoform X1 [Denticeps clupeoides]XP_028827127.1 KN motif and ankyrin repeat domain-containing protein 1-like isoform X1 [Denticeps clupeoides]XP_028827129.1 KN motif and ankyrin repeat domain-containing protein 1-like isoform X1 [Denticeps clupeoides]
MNQRKPPLPPSLSVHIPPSGNYVSSQAITASNRLLEEKHPPSSHSSAAPRPNPMVERTLMETRWRLEQEKATLPSSAPEPLPRRRLASFGGLGSVSSVSPYTGWNALKHSVIGGNKQSNDHHMQGISLGIASGGSLRHSPASSGRATPVTGVSPLHLQLVRDQMVMALQRLKEMEEQVKTIPLLKVKISILQEEKKQLVAELKNKKEQKEDTELTLNKQAHSTGSEEFALQNVQIMKESDKDLSACCGLEEFRQLTAEVQALERTIQDARLETHHSPKKSLQPRASRSVAAGGSVIMDEVVIPHQISQKSCLDVASEVKVETRSAAVGESDVMLGVPSKIEIEFESQQHIIQVLKEQVNHLEAELKEMTLKSEMNRLRNELHRAGGKNLSKKTLIQCIGTQSTVLTRSLGVGNHIELQDASTGEQWSKEGRAVSFGVSCKPDTRSVASGPNRAMTQWEVRERVQCFEKCVGNHVSMCSQAICTEASGREVGVIIEGTMEMPDRKVEHRTVGCGDCTVDVTVRPLKNMVSQGVLTEPVSKVDFGVMVTPRSVSQCTNTVLDAVSRFTNTVAARVTESSTNTSLNTTSEKHTNTSATLTRSVAIGDGKVKDAEGAMKTRSVSVDTSSRETVTNLTTLFSPVTKVTTRDTGVGFANVKENFLVGLRTRNIACGPSHLPDPTKTRSIATEVGDGRIRHASGHCHTLTQTTQTILQLQSPVVLEPGLCYYIQRMQRLLMDQQSLLSEGHGEPREVTLQPHTQLTSISSELVSALSCLDSAVRQGGTEELHSAANSQSSKASERPQTWKKNLVGKQISSALLVPLCDANSLKSIMKKKDGHHGLDDFEENLKVKSLAAIKLEDVAVTENLSEESEPERRDEASVIPQRRGAMHNLGKSLVERRKNLPKTEKSERYELNEKMLSACHALKVHLSDSKALSARELRSSLNTLQHEWFRVSSQKSARASLVEDFLCAAGSVSPTVLRHIANMADGNGNTALHYSVSHSNFTVVKRLLDADICNVDQQNKAGYTPIMLAALAAVENKEDMSVVEQLFSKGDVNAKASQAGQTALMLAVSHGRIDMVRALLASGSEVNSQDDEGSTALMCASEHGQADIVKLLLAQPDCDAALSDNDDSSALSIALEAGHKDIAMLLYAHINFSKGQTGVGQHTHIFYMLHTVCKICKLM